jgi:N-acylneuraminate cytidylyltransferase
VNIAIIPARGGSKGIKKKNIVDFLGEPLIVHTIRQAKESELIDETYVSTDAEDIADVSRNAGAQVIDRPEKYATDEASTESALLHALRYLKESDREPETMTLLQCTSPLRREQDIDETVKLVTQEGYNSALSVCEDHSFYWREGEEDAEPINYNPQKRKRRQEMKKRFRENGSIYVFETNILEKEECRLGGRIGIHEMPETHSLEIDTPEDLRIIKAVAESTSFYE